MPDFPGLKTGRHLSIAHVFMMPGVRSVLFVTLAFVLAHNILYTYIAPFLAPVGMADKVGMILLILGVSALASIWVTGALIDRWLRTLVLISIVLFAFAAVALGVWSNIQTMVYVGVGSFPWALLALLAPTLIVAWLAKDKGFPAARRD